MCIKHLFILNLKGWPDQACSVSRLQQIACFTENLFLIGVNGVGVCPSHSVLTEQAGRSKGDNSATVGCAA